jgi:hypothetical protein
MTRDRLFHAEGGASFAEVLVAMALTLIGLVGAMGAFQAAERSLQTGTLATRALAMAESRIEAERSARWDRLLLDDLDHDHDGVPDLVMHDDGAGSDALAGDGVYSGPASRGECPPHELLLPSEDMKQLIQTRSRTTEMLTLALKEGWLHWFKTAFERRYRDSLPIARSELLR